MSKLSDLSNAAHRALLGNFAVSKAALAVNAAGFNTTGTLSYVSNGVFKTLAAQTGASMAVSSASALNYVQPAATTVYYVVCGDAAGAIKVIQGSYAGQKLSMDPTAGVGVSQMGASWVGDGSIPDVPADLTPFGVFKVVTAGSAFTPGTTSMAGIATAFDVCRLPSGNL